MKAVSNHLMFLKSLPDLTQLMEDITQACNNDVNVAFLAYDVRFLRKINRVYGRKAGDALLAAIAVWTECLPGGKLYRIEGDEFCVAFPDTELALVQQYAAQFEARFDRVWSLNLDSGPIEIFAQAAIALAGDLSCDYQSELPDLLEQALELSRKNQQLTVFTAEYDRLTRERTLLQMELKHCILSGMQGFSVRYQPFADPAASTWRGLEALCRWHGPTIGAVPPSIFITEIEEMGLIHQLGNWMLDTALHDCRAMRLHEVERFFVSVNVSALQVNRHNYAQTVLDILKKHQFPPEKLMLEITESTQFSFNETTINAIEILREEGVLFALDDFGTGYSGFSNLKNLPVDMLKTDRGFIVDIQNDSYLQYFYYVMSETAHANNMLLIAEGVETQEELRNVVKNGADLIQGYLFGRPMDRKAIEAKRKNFIRPMRLFSELMSDLFDFKQWIYSQDAYKITPALFGLQSKCIGLMLEEKNLDEAIEKILETVGIYFKVNRAYVFLQDEGTTFNNQYEWCAEGVATQKHLFQQVDGRADGFFDVLRKNDVVIAKKSENLPANMKLRLEEGQQQESIQSFVVMPMKQHGEILGFVGFDDDTERSWTPEELIILHNLCLFCLIILAKDDNEETK